ncbi:hypothetical protein RND81_13G156500 [Saponaria officinalis]|uniref:Peptidase A1 domain-containing protein n=1 Tax=Saponaria officinalis TaxID=3572 RepID=A0AAW1H0E6_SAPOF
MAKSSYYITQLAFGTGPGLLNPYLLLDTACEETWVQCEGCNPCMNYEGKNFLYTASRSYRRMSINDRMCDPPLAYEGSCCLNITYIHEARTVGFIGRDTFYFKNAKTGNIDVYKDLAFGCGLKNTDFNFGPNTWPNNLIAGIHGLAPGPRSFLWQLHSQIKGRFSYCLVSWTLQSPGTSHMYFGDDAQIHGDNVRIVQTIPMHAERRYHLYLNGISVDGARLPIDMSTFELDTTTYQRGFFIDSGSPYTYLAKSVFIIIKKAIIKYFEDRFGWKPMPQGQIFDLCYSTYPNDPQSFPTMIFHFRQVGQGEVDWIMNKDNLFQILGKNEGFCFTMLDINDPGPNMFGAFQQSNFNILYDVDNGLLSFVPEKCQ